MNNNNLKFDLYQTITDKIIACLDKGVVPWKQMWSLKKGNPANYLTKKEYKGCNPLLLYCQQLISGKEYKSAYWLSFNQVQQLKGSVLKGEKASIIVFWNWIEKEVKKDNEIKKEKICYLRYYNVFNLQQTTLYKEDEVEAVKVEDKNESCENIISNLPDKLEIRYGNPAYSVSGDYVKMPEMSEFKNKDEYYASLFHELIHWTGNEKRLNRKIKNRFGDENYSREELIAELGSSFLCNIVDIDKTIDNHAAYIQSWLSVLKADKKLIVIASSQSQKAVEYILNEKEEAENE